ncbi:hypothetical protein H4R24_005072 [Coemansia sp. RSA 988]|nr:hypothetical protein H4R24_005072 [Coemansia sp. RSA 988]
MAIDSVISFSSSGAIIPSKFLANIDLRFLASIIGICLLCRFIYRVIFQLYFAPLSKLPGSKLSNLTMARVKLDALLGKLGDTTESDYYKYGDIYRIGPKSVVVCHPSDCRSVLSGHRFRKSRVYQNFALVDDNTFSTLSAELTHTRRKQVGPAFTNSYLNAMEPIVLDCGIRAIKEKWDSALALTHDNKAVVNYANHFSLASFDIIGALGFGQRFHALRDNTSKIIDWVQSTATLCGLRLIFNVEAFPAKLFTKKIVRDVDEFVAFSNAATDKRKNELSCGVIEKPKDILQAMIDAEDPNSKIRMTRSQITAENITFLLAGTDTTSLTLSWTIHYLMLYPQICQKAVNEVRSRFPRYHLITYAEGKTQLPYIEACIYESLRIRAVTGTTLSRVVPKEGATFQGYSLPGGTQINVNIAGANHHQQTWEAPRRFMPERFIENEAAKHDVFTFSSGVRICPGRKLAFYEMMTILANLLKDYDIVMAEDSLFVPGRLDENGYPMAMPRAQNLTVGPKYPDRDCCIVISAAEY